MSRVLSINEFEEMHIIHSTNNLLEEIPLRESNEPYEGRNGYTSINYLRQSAIKVKNLLLST